MASYNDFDSHVPYEDGLQVIGAGLPRTGTTSMLEALRILYGVPGYHMVEVFKKDTSLFWSAMQRGTPTLDDIRAHFAEYAHV
jgi:Sulfotransferase domain